MLTAITILIVGSARFNIYGFGDLMKASGWNLNILQSPACIHLCCTMLHAQSGVADRFIKDVKVAVKKVRIYSIVYIHIQVKNKLIFSYCIFYEYLFQLRVLAY